MKKFFLPFLLTVVPWISSAQVGQDYLECLDRYTERLSGKLKRGDLQEIHGQCRALKLLPADQRDRLSDFDEYYIKCKAFRIRQIPKLGLKEVRARYAVCKNLAELYIKAERTQEGPACKVQSCYRTDGKEKCGGDQTYAVTESSLCRKVFAPLQCMEESEIPDAVLWDDGKEKGNLNCWRL